MSSGQTAGWPPWRARRSGSRAPARARCRRPSPRSWSGSGAAAALDGFGLGRALLALGVSLALQVGVNYANDYSDGIRGTDADRVGPLRLTGSGAARPGQVKARGVRRVRAGGALLGLVLVALSGHWWLIAVGVACVAAAWFYTGGSNPYGYSGFGEIFVFVFFGLVAVLGTTYTQAGRISGPAVAGACAVGALACAILVANNLRDIPTDATHRQAHPGGAARRRPHPHPVRRARGRGVRPRRRGGPLAPGRVDRPGRRRRWRSDRCGWSAPGATGRELIAVLKDTGRLELGYAVLLAVGLAL